MAASAVRTGLRQKQRSAILADIDDKENNVHQSHMEYARALIKKYDKDRSGKLNRKEVHKVLLDISDHGDVSQDELDFVFKVADASGDGHFHASEMCALLSCWDNYQKSKSQIELHFLKHDPDNTGRLTKDQLWGLLSELSGRHQVEREDVAWLMKQSNILKTGYLTKPELRRALALWQVRMQNKENNVCCTVM